MQNNYTTERLILSKLHISDAPFIYELVNTQGWIQFIGDRNVKNLTDAEGYVQRINDNPNVTYWVVRTKAEDVPIGLITLIKRDYLEHSDIGFAFLPEHAGKGYAYEGAIAVLRDLANDPAHTHFVAIIVGDNTNSIKLSEKLGLRFSHEFERDGETLSQYRVSADKVHIDHLVEHFFDVFTNVGGRQPNLDAIHHLCLLQAIIVKKIGNEETVYDLEGFIEPRRTILTDGTLTEFKEWEVSEETKIIGQLAQRHSAYKKSGRMNGQNFEGAGNKMFQFIKTTDGWRICSVIWEDEG
ncbi:GNAT family N-acetyltransferase [Flavipsychrobacter stenotrophus]|uniref:GNAT family N-acetyltransferase n=1 Tax=Flavipsychrobacter stenotrophus TaxID=2077091 RepID=UPI00196AC40B|nr:GNAT family N-acetyltransferase [Flavipsychrobacter stenotrophus]